MLANTKKSYTGIMITFLRKIRKGIIGSGDFRKYLLYATGEVALVVIGILIALQINNWNETRQQQRQIDTFLQNLKNDLTNDIVFLDRLAGVNLFRLYSMQYLLQLAGREKYDAVADGNLIPEWTSGNFIWNQEIPEEYNKDLIRLAFLWSHRVGTSGGSSNITTIGELKSTGRFSEIKSESLKSAINDYYSLRSFRVPDSSSGNQSTVQEWHQSLSKEGIVNSNPFLIADPISLLRDDKGRSGILRRLCRGASWIAEGAPIVAKEARQLIKLIEHD